MHASNLVNDIKELNKDIRFFGLGGERMEEAGVDILENITHLAFIGPAGLFKHYIKLRAIYNSLIARLNKNVPHCAILIDYAEFNLRVARHLKRLGVPIIYYISPQVWAWGLWRIKTIRRLIDKVLVFFKFEEVLYRNHGVDATFVGHPLLNSVKMSGKREDILKGFGIDKDTVIVGLVPGSRNTEIEKILPVMLNSCRLILERLKEKKIQFLLPLAPTVDESLVRRLTGRSSLKINIIKGAAYDCIGVCDSAMVTSGTATLETALLGTPMVIIYKANFLTYILTRMLIKLPYIGIVNIISNKKIVPEFLQYEASPKGIADYMVKLLTDKELALSMKRDFFKVRDSLGEPGASKRAAIEVVNFMAHLQYSHLKQIRA
jgi:lipid-A-disaccharide synthase